MFTSKSLGIVPIKGEALVPATHIPHLTYHQGHLLTSVEVYTIFWGTGWQQAPQNGLIQPLNDFFDFILTSSLMDVLREYSVPGQIIGHGQRVGTNTITTSDPGTANPDGSRVVTDAQIQQAFLQDWIPNNTIRQPNNRLFFVYLPPNVTSELGGFDSCAAGGFCGYHSNINHNIFYAVIPFINCDGCISGQNLPFDSLTEVSSHELCESITDPDQDDNGNPTGWNDDNLNPGEIGDICNFQATQLGGYNVQTEWSNQASACVVVGSPIVTLSRTTIDFHSVPVGYSPAPTAPITLTNTGSASLVITGTSISGDPSFTYLDNQTCEGATLAPGESCTVTVEFDPLGAKVFHATFMFTDNASDSPQRVALKGEGKPSNK